MNSLNSDSEESNEPEDAPSMVEKELAFRASADEVMDCFDSDQDGLLGTKEAQVMLDRCFGKG